MFRWLLCTMKGVTLTSQNQWPTVPTLIFEPWVNPPPVEVLGQACLTVCDGGAQMAALKLRHSDQEPRIHPILLDSVLCNLLSMATDLRSGLSRYNFGSNEEEKDWLLSP